MNKLLHIAYECDFSKIRLRINQSFTGIYPLPLALSTPNVRVCCLHLEILDEGYTVFFMCFSFCFFSPIMTIAR